MKIREILYFNFCTLCIFLFSSCTPGDVSIQEMTATPAEQTTMEIPTAEFTITEEIKQQQISVPATVQPTEMPLPVFPNREKLSYFDFLLDYDDLPVRYQHNYMRIYDAARYEDHYSLRVVYQGNEYALSGCYLSATVTFADSGYFDSEVLSENYDEMFTADFPTLGEHSGVYRAPRRLVWMVENNVYIEVAQIGGGTCEMTPDEVYALTETLSQKIPETMPDPEDFELNFPTPEFSQDDFNHYVQRLEFNNFSINDGNLNRIATDLFCDTWLEYQPNYPIREVMIGIYDPSMDEYVYQRYHQSSYTEYRNVSHHWLYYDLSTAFDLIPMPGNYDIRLWMEQSCVFERSFELYIREDK